MPSPAMSEIKHRVENEMRRAGSGEASRGDTSAQSGEVNYVKQYLLVSNSVVGAGSWFGAVFFDCLIYLSCMDPPSGIIYMTANQDLRTEKSDVLLL